MDSINEEGIIITAFMLMLLTSGSAFAPASRQRYVPPVEYERFEFDLDRWTPKRVRRTLRFTKEEIRLLIGYFDLDKTEYRGRIRPSPEFALCLLLYKLSCPGPLYELARYFERSETYLSIVLNDVLEHLRRRYNPILCWHPTLTDNRIRLYAHTNEVCGALFGLSLMGPFEELHAQIQSSNSGTQSTRNLAV